MRTSPEYWWSLACNYDGWRSRLRGAIGDTLSICRGDCSDGGNPRRPWGHGPWLKTRTAFRRVLNAIGGTHAPD